jgi:glycosyltransferase involved in cell wall biosynthesis
MNPVKISFITINFNGSKFISSCVESVLSQTIDDWEHIIVDCGSTDDSLQILASLEHSRLRVYSIGQCGLSYARNFAVDNSHGEVCAILDIDDVAMPNRAKIQLQKFDNDRSIVAVGGDAIVEYSSNVMSFTPYSWYRFLTSVWRKVFLNNQIQRYPINHKEILALSLGCINPIPHSNLSFKKSAFKSICGYSEYQPRGEDLDLVLRLALFGPVIGLNEVVGIIRFSRPTSYGYRSIPGVRDSYFYCYKALLTRDMNIIERTKADSAVVSWLESIGPEGRVALQGKWILGQIFCGIRENISRGVLWMLSKEFLKRTPYMLISLKHNWMRDFSNHSIFMKKYVLLNSNIHL